MLHPKQENKMNSEHSRRTVDCCLFRLPGQRSHVAACAELRAHAEVTAVCSTRNVDMVRSIGADQVIDYTQEDFTRKGQRYDLILAVNGYHPIFAYRRPLRPTGRYVLVGEGSNAHLFRAVLQAMLLGPVISRTGRQKMGFM
jgi:NADPH:quinone reductase-like Zn-dependent oxidoreductase